MPLRSFSFVACLVLLSHTSGASALTTPGRTWGGTVIAVSPNKSQLGTNTNTNTNGLRVRGGGALELSPATIQLAETLAPKFGILSSTALYFAPAAAVLAAVRSDDIGDLNPLPLAIMSIVSIAWLTYGLSKRDLYVTLSNIAGCVGSLAYVVYLLPLLKSKKQLRQTQGVVVAGAASVLGLWTYLGLSGASSARISTALGRFAACLFVILAGSPLTTIQTVISTQDSSSILGSLTIAQVVNTFLWAAYGLAIRDTFVWGPNVAGLCLGLVQLALKLLFPVKKRATASS